MNAASGLVGALAIALLAAAGCGGEHRAPLSADAYRARVGRICGESQRAAVAELRHAGGDGERAARRLSSLARRAAARMDRLKPPPALARDAARLVTATRRPAIIVEDAGIDLANGADPRVAARRARRRLRAALAQSRLEAHRLAVPACRPPRLEGL